tara:strand:+ start:102 stop:473 length:372 start_codon:yes stop_codon:yes gene_type:complete
MAATNNDHIPSQTTIIIQSQTLQNTEVSQLQDIGTQLTKLMYNPNKTELEGTTIIVVLPESSIDTESYQIDRQSSKSRLSRDEKNHQSIKLLEHVISLQNSIKHIVKHALKHGINIKIQSNSD